MNLARMLFKSKWQDKNPEIRRAAVANDNDAELLAALTQIGRSDADAGVRMAALKRLNDYEAWRERSTGDSDGAIRGAARVAYVALLCSNDARVPALPRRIAELDTLSSEEIEKIASQASDRELRAVALARVTRPALLAERALADPDAKLRLAALERISDAAALERIAERARKTDKAINRRARELAAAQRIGGGDTDAIALKAQALCERMESLMRASAAADDSARAAVEHQWQALGGRVPAELQMRYRGAETLVRQMQSNMLNPLVRAISMANLTAAAPITLSSAAQTDAAQPALLSVELLASQARFDVALASAAAESQRERELRRMHLHEIEELAPQYATALDAGDVTATHGLHRRLAALTDTIGTLPAHLEDRLAPLHARYGELKRWQQWANQQRRQAICASIESLPQASLHPDALATRIREAREEWQRLDTSEGSPGPGESDPAGSGLTRRFHTLCHRTLKPTKAYFNKRDELRHTHSEAIEALLQSAASLPAEIADWKSAGTLRQQLIDTLRSLDAVDPRERTRLGKRIKAAIAALAPRIEAHVDAVENAKKALIERATGLSRQSDPRSVAREARDLQQQWTALGNGKRAIDQRQWKGFRGACDAAFNRLDSVRKERDAQSAASRAHAQGLLDEIDALRVSTVFTGDAIKTKLRDLDARWTALRCDDRAFERRYRKSHDAIAAQLRDAARTQHLSRYTQALEKYTLLREIETGAESGEDVTPHWQSLQATAADFAAALDARYARATEGNTPPPSDAAQARNRLVELEFLAGADTPAEDRQRRMNYQVQRLAARMRDSSTPTPEAELTRILLGWFAQAPQDVELEMRFVHAAHAALATLP